MTCHRLPFINLLSSIYIGETAGKTYCKIARCWKSGRIVGHLGVLWLQLRMFQNFKSDIQICFTMPSTGNSARWIQTLNLRIMSQLFHQWAVVAGSRILTYQKHSMTVLCVIDYHSFTSQVVFMSAKPLAKPIAKLLDVERPEELGWCNLNWECSKTSKQTFKFVSQCLVPATATAGFKPSVLESRANCFTNEMLSLAL